MLIYFWDVLQLLSCNKQILGSSTENKKIRLVRYWNLWFIYNGYFIQKRWTKLVGTSTLFSEHYICFVTKYSRSVVSTKILCIVLCFLTSLEVILPFFRTFTNSSKLGRPHNSNSFNIVKSALKNKFLLPKLAFFSNDYIRKDLFRRLMFRFVKVVMKSTSNLTNIGLTNKRLLLFVRPMSKKIEFGFWVWNSIQNNTQNAKDIDTQAPEDTAWIWFSLSENSLSV